MKTRNTQAGNQNELLSGRELGHGKLNLPRQETKTIGFHWTGNRLMKNGSLSGEGWASTETESGATKMRVSRTPAPEENRTTLVPNENRACLGARHGNWHQKFGLDDPAQAKRKTPREKWKTGAESAHTEEWAPDSAGKTKLWEKKSCIEIKVGHGVLTKTQVWDGNQSQREGWIKTKHKTQGQSGKAAQKNWIWIEMEERQYRVEPAAYAPENARGKWKSLPRFGTRHSRTKTRSTQWKPGTKPPVQRCDPQTNTPATTDLAKSKERANGTHKIRKSFFHWNQTTFIQPRRSPPSLPLLIV
jgi:hypothetical protein